MEKDIFKDLLFDILNEYAEEEMRIRDISVKEQADAMELELADGSRFEIKIRKVA